MKIVIAILVFSIIIIIHELGHFLLAKKNGIGVVEFSIGLGPTIFGVKKGETKYSVKLLPFGGMCQMVGEDSDQNTPAENAFYSKGVWQRFSVVFAGPLFNFILAFLLSLVVIGSLGYDPATAYIVKNSPAEAAGLQNGDLIKKIDGDSITIGRELDSYFMYNAADGTPIKVVYERDGEEYSTEVVPVKTKKYLFGFTYDAKDTPGAIITEVSEGSAFEEAGMKKDDVITAVNGVPVANGIELSAYMDANPADGSVASFTYERNGASTTVEIASKFSAEYYDVGLSYDYRRVDAGVFNTIKYSFVEIKYWIETTVKNLGLLITGQLGSEDVGGPVAIVDSIGTVYEQTKEYGTAKDVFLQMAYITILLSANLGVMNLLPIPALDGGKLVFTLIEAVRGKPIDREKEGLVHLIGMVLLLLLMAFIFFNDIRNVFFK